MIWTKPQRRGNQSYFLPIVLILAISSKNSALESAFPTFNNVNMPNESYFMHNDRENNVYSYLQSKLPYLYSKICS